MGLLAKADCQRLIAESLPKCFGCGYAALWKIKRQMLTAGFLSLDKMLCGSEINKL
jgi:hypothetical protein